MRVSVGGVTLEDLEGYDPQRVGMRRREHDRRGTALPGRLEPPQGAQAPAVARHESREAPFRPRRHQVVAGRDGEVEELPRHHGADGVAAAVAGDRLAATVAEEPGERIGRAGFEDPAEDVAGRAG